MATKRRSENFWLQHVRAWRGSGLTQTRYCAREGLSVHSLRYWVKRKMPLESSKLNLVPVQMRAEWANSMKGCVVRGLNGVTIAFAETPTASYVAQLLRNER